METEDGDDAMMVTSAEDELVSMLYGTLVAAPTPMYNQDGAQGIYFAFPDVSVRYAGLFRLKANLLRITG